MVPKTERFELRLDPDTLKRIDEWRSGQSDLPSRAEAIRRLVESSLARSGSKEFKPNKVEMLMLWMVAELLKQQKGQEGRETAELVHQVIYGGHFWALERQLPDILHNHVDSETVLNFVFDTLDMWRLIEDAYTSFSAADKARIKKEVDAHAKSPKFIGFDGNNEGEYMGIARFLIDKMGLYQEFKGRDLNSHWPMVERYDRMINLFEPMRKTLVGRRLSVDQVIELLKRERE